MLLCLRVIRRIALFATFLLTCLQAEAAHSVALARLQQGGELAGEALGLRFLRDEAQSLTVDEVRKLPDQQFAVLRQRDINQHFQRADYWLKTSVHNSSDAGMSWVLRHPMPITDDVEYWIFANGTLVTHAVGGDQSLMRDRQIPYRIASVRHTSAPGQVAEIVIRLRNRQTSPMYLAFGLSSEAAFLKKTANDQLLTGILYGIPFALMVYALAGWLLHRTRSSLIYVAYVLAVMGSWMGINGQLAQYVFIDRPDIAHFMLIVFFLLAIIAHCMFAREFLHTRRLMPRLDRYFIAVIALAGFGIVLRMLGCQLAVTQVTIALLLTHAIAPVVAIIALRGRLFLSRWYLLAQLVYNAALVIGIAGARYADLSYENYFFYCQLAFIAEIVLLGVAQQDMVRLLQHKKSAVEQKYQEALQANNAALARQLEQRTGQLREARQRSAFMADVKAATGRIANGEFSVRLAPGQSAELAELAHNVNVMAASLSRLEGARKRWIADISHELRMPLFSLQCETEALLDGVRSLNQRAIVSIHEEVMRLSRLVSDLHEVALSYLRPLPCTFTRWDLAALLSKKSDEYVRRAQAKGLRFSLDAPAAAVPVEWDRGRVEQLIDNLVQNSISYTDAPGALALVVTAAPQRVTIHLQDTLPGVTPDDARHLFEPLYRAEMARTRRAGGSGLGLSICQSIVQAHGGTITAAPSPLGGLAILIDLPRAAEAA